MRVAVTGADGFTGRFVTSELDRRQIPWVALVGDVRNEEAIEERVRSSHFDKLIHLAGLAFSNNKAWEDYYKVNQIGTFNLLSAVAKHKPGTSCILASSAAVYGPDAVGFIAESQPARPGNHYGVSKLAMEIGSQVWKDSLNIKIVRPFNYTGLGQSSIYLIPKIVSHFRLRKAKIELGNVDVQRDFGDVRQVAKIYCDLLMISDQPGVLNIATGEVYSISDIMVILESFTNHQVEICINRDFVRKNDPALLAGDITLLSEILPNFQMFDLRETLEWMLFAAEGDG